MDNIGKDASPSGGEPKTEKSSMPPPALPNPPDRRARRTKLSDYGDAKLQDQWKLLLEEQRRELEMDILAITPPRQKLDEIAQRALKGLYEELRGCASGGAAGAKGGNGKAGGKGLPSDSQALEATVRAYIVRNGFASEVKKITDRLNSTHMTDGRRWVLSVVYPLLLHALFWDEANQMFREREELKDLIEDDLGVAEHVLLDLDAKGGPVELFARSIVDMVMKKHKVTEDTGTVLEIVSQQVRSAI